MRSLCSSWVFSSLLSTLSLSVSLLALRSATFSSTSSQNESPHSFCLMQQRIERWKTTIPSTIIISTPHVRFCTWAIDMHMVFVMTMMMTMTPRFWYVNNKRRPLPVTNGVLMIVPSTSWLNRVYKWRRWWHLVNLSFVTVIWMLTKSHSFVNKFMCCS